MFEHCCRCVLLVQCTVFIDHVRSTSLSKQLNVGVLHSGLHTKRCSLKTSEKCAWPNATVRAYISRCCVHFYLNLITRLSFVDTLKVMIVLHGCVICVWMYPWMCTSTLTVTSGANISILLVALAGSRCCRASSRGLGKISTTTSSGAHTALQGGIA